MALLYIVTIPLSSSNSQDFSKWKKGCSIGGRKVCAKVRRNAGNKRIMLLLALTIVIPALTLDFVV
jgi:hypothetical protein